MLVSQDHLLMHKSFEGIKKKKLTDFGNHVRELISSVLILKVFLSIISKIPAYKVGFDFIKVLYYKKGVMV